MDVRPAIASDIDAAVALMQRTRRQYQKYQPTFWRTAPKSTETTKAFFTKLQAEQGTFFLVATEGRQVVGFLVARKFATPPVYAPGGDTYQSSRSSGLPNALKSPRSRGPSDSC